MSEQIWQQLKNSQLTPELRLRELVFSDSRHGVFRADYSGAAENGRELIAQVFLESRDYPLERVQRFLEAKYLNHPNLLRYFDAGTVLKNEATLTFAVTESPGEWASGQLTPEEALKLAQDLICGLEYLHKRNLVYCVLSPGTVMRVGEDWKLSDFSQLRVAGSDTSDEARSLDSAADSSPPEAIEGFISPAWDVWSLGQTVRKALGLNHAALPDPFRAVVLACMNLRPSSRPSLEQLSGLIRRRAPFNLQSAGMSA